MTDHSHSDLAHKGDPSLDRLLFFSDGVFAIAITLLSIELHVPHGWDGTFAGLIREGWPMLGAFAISFAVIGILWNAHRRAFLRMIRFTSGVFVLNLLQLGGIALIPFATQLLYVQGPKGESVLIYLALVTLIGLIQGMSYGYAAFVADAIRPRHHRMLQLSAAAMQAFMPGLCSGLALMFLGDGPVWITVTLAVALVALLALRRYAHKRFGGIIRE